MFKALQKLFLGNSNEVTAHFTPIISPDKYRAFIKSKTSASGVFMSRDPDHIPTVLEVLFETAKKRVEVFSDNLNPLFYGQSYVVEAATQFLKGNPDAKIQVILDQEIGNSHPLVIALREQGLLDRLELWRRIPEKSDDKFEFIVADDRSYRFQGFRNSLEAIVDFNDEEVGFKISRIFANLKTHSQPVPTPLDQKVSFTEDLYSMAPT